jgi:predicted HTH transcriptional regulator
MEMAVLKTLAAFLNTGGGTLVIGVHDDGTPLGIGADGFASEDKMSLHLVNIVKERINPQALTAMHMHFEDHDGERMMIVRCQKSPAPVFMKDGEHERFYVRTGPSTTELKASQTLDYIKQRFDN